MSEELVSVIVLTHNRRRQVGRCVKSILSSDHSPLEVLIVDDASSDGTREMLLRDFPGVSVIRHEKPTLTAQGIHDGARACRGSFVVIVDDDNVLDSRAISELVATFHSDGRIGVVGPICLFLSEPERIMYGGARLSRLSRKAEFVYKNRLTAGLPSDQIDVDMFPNCFAVRRDVLLSATPIDVIRLPFFNDDASIQLFAKKQGLRVVLNPRAITWHDHPLQDRSDRSPPSDLRMYYLVRSKFFLERDFDSRAGRITFSLSVPLFVAAHAATVLRSRAEWSVKRHLLRVLSMAVLDGLLEIPGVKYVE